MEVNDGRSGLRQQVLTMVPGDASADVSERGQHAAWREWVRHRINAHRRTRTRGVSVTNAARLSRGECGAQLYRLPPATLRVTRLTSARDSGTPAASVVTPYTSEKVPSSRTASGTGASDSTPAAIFTPHAAAPARTAHSHSVAIYARRNSTLPRRCERACRSA